METHWKNTVKLEDTDLLGLAHTFEFDQETLVQAFEKPFRAIPGEFECLLNEAKRAKDILEIVEKYPFGSMTQHMKSAFILRAACFFKKKTHAPPRRSHNHRASH